MVFISCKFYLVIFLIFPTVSTNGMRKMRKIDWEYIDKILGMIYKEKMLEGKINAQ